MGYPLSTFALGPVLLVQGLMTRRRVPRLPEPPGERHGVSGSGDSLRLLIAGDSAAAGVGAPHQDEALLGQVVSRLAPRCRVTWRLEARTGATTASTLAALRELPAERYDAVITSLGVNDVTHLVRRAVWCRRQAELRTLLRERFGASLLVISGLPPVHGFPALPQPLRSHLGRRATEFNADLRRDIAREPDCAFVDLRMIEDASLMASDGFHPGPGVYALWGRRVVELLLEPTRAAAVT